ncbi:short-chain collagen C4-like [Saccostrea echinata]|uniref:short-chain collagen C4-like n=1 Tax=Saccostrea echinata TaxID=191078 RepID=UPI002A829197|nr:short-chain collagen C4-like [Saccostrea echinata]
MLIKFLFLWYFIQDARFEKEEKRILLNDPGLVEQRLNHLEQELQMLKIENQKLKASQSGNSAVYTRWGRKECPSNVSEIIYSGFAAGGWWNDKGSPTNYLCLPPDPIPSGKSVTTSCNHLFGVEYESGFWGPHSHNEDAPCAVCSSTSGSKMLMRPGRDTCYQGWTKQYDGYLGTNELHYVGATEYVCVDHSPSYLNAGERSTDGALFHPVTYQCGALQCPPYTGDEVVNCVVCTK